MDINMLFHHYQEALIAQYSARLLPCHYHALNAFLHCRANYAGQMKLHCTGCDRYQFKPQSCGHRHCAQCQNHETSAWLDKQYLQLLPVDYFMVTFTLPFQYRELAWHHQRKSIYLLINTCNNAFRACSTIE